MATKLLRGLKEIGAHCGDACERTVKRWIDKFDDFPISKVGRLYLVDPDDLVEWMMMHQRRADKIPMIRDEDFID